MEIVGFSFCFRFCIHDQIELAAGIDGAVSSRSFGSIEGSIGHFAQGGGVDSVFWIESATNAYGESDGVTLNRDIFLK